MGSVRFERLVVYLLAIAATLGILSVPVSGRPHDPMRFMDRTIWFGVASTVALYLALLPGALAATFPRLPGLSVFESARRALGVSAFALATPHAAYGFFGWVGGFEGLQWWSADYALSLVLGFVAWLITLALAATSFDAAVRWLGGRWRALHRWVYAAGVLTVAHAMIVTIHVLPDELRRWLVLSYVALAALLVLEALRLRRALAAKAWRDVVAFGGLAVVLGVSFWSFFLISHHRH